MPKKSENQLSEISISKSPNRKNQRASFSESFPSSPLHPKIQINAKFFDSSKNYFFSLLGKCPSCRDCRFEIYPLHKRQKIVGLKILYNGRELELIDPVQLKYQALRILADHRHHPSKYKANYDDSLAFQVLMNFVFYFTLLDQDKGYLDKYFIDHDCRMFFVSLNDDHI